MCFMGMVTAVRRSVVALCNPEFGFEQVYRDLADVRLVPSDSIGVEIAKIIPK